jgi:ribosome biogenesis GTPase / thiamine phosphate phosphatase
VHRQMVVLDAGGVIIDTPGIRELQLWEADEAVGEAFGDIAELAARCRFRDCSHDREPGCAVRAAADDGQLDAGRYANFLKLQQERRAFEEKRDERARAEEKRQSKIVHRALRSLQKDRDRR